VYIDIRAQLVPILASFVALGIGIVIGGMLSTDHGLLQLVPILASFMALGIGIVIGGMLSTDHGLLIEQQLLIDDLEQQFAELRDSANTQREELARLREALSEREQVIEQLLPDVARSRLAGLNIVLLDIQGGELSDRVWGASLMVVRAGTEAQLMSLDSTVASVIHDRLMAAGRVDGPFVEGFGVVGQLSRKPDSVVIVVDPGLDQLFGALLTPLVASLHAENIHLVAIEQSRATSSFVDMWRRLNVSTVDNVESPLGLLSLVFLAEGQTGHYGVGPSVDRLVPVLDVPVDR